MTKEEIIKKTKIGQGYYQAGYGRGFKKAPIVWLINGKAYAKDSKGDAFKTDLPGFKMLNAVSREDTIFFAEVGLIREHQQFETKTTKAQTKKILISGEWYFWDEEAQQWKPESYKFEKTN